MAIGNLNLKTTKLFMGLDIVIDNYQYYDAWNFDGTYDTSTAGQVRKSKGANGTFLSEYDYIDLGIITDEREEVTIGGIPISIPGTGADQRIFWAIGGKSIRVTISGIIPDGNYVGLNGNGGVGADWSTGLNLNGLSNVSVFRYKLNALLAYDSFGVSNISPHNVQYRRRYMEEINEQASATTNAQFPDNAHSNTFLAKWILTSYSIGFIDGTRNIRYTITLDLSNNGTSIPALVATPLHPNTSGNIGATPLAFGYMYQTP